MNSVTFTLVLASLRKVTAKIVDTITLLQL
jgi:hypothetical protein